MVYNKISWKVFWIIIKYGNGALWKADKLVADNSEAQTGCPITYTYTVNSMKKLLQGFRINNIFIDHIFPYRIPDYVQHKYKKVWYFKIIPQRLFRKLEKKFGWHLCVTAKLNN